MSNDKLEDLLEGAFRAELADVQDIDVSHRILANLRRRNRIRTLCLGGIGVLALALAAFTVQPALIELVDWVAASEPVATGELAAAMKNLGVGVPVLLAIALAPWLLALLDDQV